MTASFYSRLLFQMLCIYLMVAVLIPKYISFSAGLFLLSTDRLALILILLIMAVGLISLKSIRQTLWHNMLFNRQMTFLLLALFSVQFTSALSSPDTAYSLKRFMNFALLAGVPYFGIFMLQTKYVDFRFLARTFTISSLLLVVICSIELYTQQNVFSAFLDTETLNEFQKDQVIDKLRGTGHRVQGSFAHPLSFGHFCVTITPILLYLRAHSRERLLLSLSLLALLVIMLFTRSRTVLIIFIISMLVYGTHYLRFHRHNIAIKGLNFMLLCIAASSIITIFDPEILDDFFGGKSLTEDTNRLTQLTTAVPLIFDSLWLGNGFGLGSQTLGFGLSQSDFGTIDNYFLTVVLDSGIVALALFMLICYQSLKLYFRLYANAKYVFYGLLFFMINLFTLSIIEVHTYFYFFIALTLLTTNKSIAESRNHISQLQ